ncbi:MAG: transglycosylase SLT domain-containing protein [Gemmatimonadales bacterium]|nr:transglycosylase SLT domain-containing protein [Gemmatimonadales bacterium]
MEASCLEGGQTAPSALLAYASIQELISSPVDTLPLGPDGLPTLETLENLCSTALGLTADGELGLAQDQLFTLQDLLENPLPAGTDSLYSSHHSSLGRRVWLLAGVIAEQEAFAHKPTETDSLLATGYGRLSQMAFPDSLVPATGINLTPITADLLKIDNKAVAKWIAYFTGRGRRNFQFWLDRKSAVESLITTILVEEGLPQELVYLAMIESGLSPYAVSSVNAVGPWQFMAGTAKSFGLKRNWWVDERRDFEMSTRAAARYLSQLYKQFGDWALALAAYNSGENRVDRRIRQHGHDNFWNLRLPSQTVDYVPKFIAAARIGENREEFGFAQNSAIPLGYEVLLVDDATDLDLIARCAGVTPEVVRKLNPALLRGASPAGLKDYPVRVPEGTGAAARQALAKIPADRRLTWRRHKVARGETLGQIARNYGTSVADVARLNKLGNVHLIRPGDPLLIPMPAELASKAAKRSAEKGHYVPPDGWERVSYKVRSGDTLGGIARKLRVSVKHLRRVNGIQKTNLIFPGQRIFAYRPGG